MRTHHAAWAVIAPALLLVASIETAGAQDKGTESTPRNVLVVNTGDGTVSRVDLTTMKEIDRHKAGPRPYGIAVSQDGRTVAVGVEDEQKVKFFALPDFKPKGEVPIGKMFNDH